MTLHQQAVAPVRKFDCPHCHSAIQVLAPASRMVVCSRCRGASRIDGNSLHPIEGPLPPPRGATFAPGTILQVRGQRAQVSGVIQYREAGGGITTMYELTGPAGKGASLEEENGNWTLYREFANGPQAIKKSGHGEIQVSGRRFLLEGKYRGEVTALIGEFEELPRIGSFEHYAYFENEYADHDMVCELSGRDSPVAWYTSQLLRAGDLKMQRAAGGSRSRPAAFRAVPSNENVKQQIVWWSAIFAALAVVMHLAFVTLEQGRLVYQSETKTADSRAAPWTSESFRLDGRTSNVLAKVSTNLDNQWLDLQLTLINTKTGRWYRRHEDLLNFHGYEDGEYWTEGGRDHGIYFSSVPAGEYVLEAVAYVEQPRIEYRVSLLRDVTNSSYLFYVLIGFGVLPVLFMLRRMNK